MDESTAIVRPSAGVAPEARLAHAECAVAALARAVERQLVIAERRGVRLDRIGREVVGRIADRARCDRRGDQESPALSLLPRPSFSPQRLLWPVPLPSHRLQPWLPQLPWPALPHPPSHGNMPFAAVVTSSDVSTVPTEAFRLEEYRNRLLQCRSVRRSHCADGHDRRDQPGSKLSQKEIDICVTLLISGENVPDRRGPVTAKMPFCFSGLLPFCQCSVSEL